MLPKATRLFSAALLLGSLIPALWGCGASSGTSQPAALARVKAETLVPADGAAHFDPSGVAALKALPGDTENGESLKLVSSYLSGGPVLELQSAYTFLSAFYLVGVDGPADAKGPVALSFKTTDPAARVLALSDLSLPSVLDIEPKDGLLTVFVPAGPLDGSALPDVSYAKTGEVRYALVKPNQPFFAREAAAPGTFSDCALWGNCRKRTGKVQVVWADGLGVTSADADQAVRIFEEKLEEYQGLGLSSAAINLNWDAPLIVKVNTADGEPQYGTLFGGINVSASDVARMRGQATEVFGNIAHELAHYMQDKHYNLIPAAFSGPKKWWLETTADNLAFALVPEMAAYNAETYGDAENELGGRFSTQFPPLTWDFPEGYLASHFLRLNLCRNTAVCPLTTGQMILAVDEGQYPFTDASRRAKLSANLHEYSRYLLGLAPLEPAMARPTANIAEGLLIGDTVTAKTHNGALNFTPNGHWPRVAKTPEKVSFSTTVSRDGLYLLEARNDGVQGANTVALALPLMLEVDSASAPFRLRKGEAPETSYFPSGQKRVVAPITTNLGGMPGARIAALGLGAENTPFNAELKVVDLSGDWAVKSISPVSSTISSDAPELTGYDETAFLDSLVNSTKALAKLGSFARRQGDTVAQLSFAVDQGQSAGEGVIDGKVTIASDRVTLNLGVDYASTQPEAAEYLTVLTLNALEYTGDEADPSKPLWALSGTAATTVHWTKVLSDGQPHTVTGTLSWNVEVEILKDGVLSEDTAMPGRTWWETAGGQSCYAILQANPAAASGVYNLDIDGEGPNQPFPMYCDMTGDEAGTPGSGGWMLLARDPGTAYDMPFEEYTGQNHWLGSLANKEGLLSASKDALPALMPNGQVRFRVDYGPWYQTPFTLNGNQAYYNGGPSGANPYFAWFVPSPVVLVGNTAGLTGNVTQFYARISGSCPVLLSDNRFWGGHITSGTAGLGDYNYQDGFGCWTTPSTGPTSGEAWIK